MIDNLSIKKNQKVKNIFFLNHISYKSNNGFLKNLFFINTFTLSLCEEENILWLCVHWAELVGITVINSNFGWCHLYSIGRILNIHV